MRKTIATLGVVGLGLMSAAVTANAAPPEEKKITICHATNAAGNPFVVETINLSALKAHADDTRDIAPANDGDIYPDGQNLTAANLALLANNCVAVVPPVDTDPVDETPDPVDETPDPVDETPDPVDETPEPEDDNPGGGHDSSLGQHTGPLSWLRKRPFRPRNPQLPSPQRRTPATSRRPR